jgi:SAM-dependent methyltransferase
MGSTLTPDGRSGACAGCGAANPSPVVELSSVPTHTSVLMRTQEEALSAPRGELALVQCAKCGFVGNAAFDPRLTEYSERTEETQAFSATYRAYHDALVDELVGEFGVRGKRVVEIGCGKGEFLAELCARGDNIGIGFDPAFRPDRHPCPDDRRVTFKKALFGEGGESAEADVYVSKMTLEHIANVGAFLRGLRSMIGDRREALVFFQVPESAGIFHDVRVCDLLYEHCSYFTAASLRAVFEIAGFDVVETRVSYGGQHLSVIARPGSEPSVSRPEQLTVADGFARQVDARVKAWDDRLRVLRSAGHRSVVWGSGSKATAFLNLVPAAASAIHAVVDINPFRQGAFMAGTGHSIIEPAVLKEIDPQAVIVMNPIYLDEIRQDLSTLGLTPELIPV